LYRLSEESLRGEYQPLLAFEGLGASILTGVSPLRHGIWTEFIYDPLESPFKWSMRMSRLGGILDKVIDKTGPFGHWMGAGLALFVFKVSQRSRGATYTPMAIRIPFNKLHFFNVSIMHDLLLENPLAIPTIFELLLERGILFKVLSESEMRDSRILKEGLNIERNVRLTLIQLSELDIVGHEKGPNSRAISRSLRAIDAKVQKIVEKHKSNFATDIFIFSDHGMVEVKKTVNVSNQLHCARLTEGRDFIAFFDSTLARFWTLKPEAKQKITEALDTINGGTVLSDNDLKRYQIPNCRKYGEIIWLADPGTLILPNYYQGSRLVHGMHGYSPETDELRSPFIICSDNIEPTKVEHIASPMDVFATMLDLLGITIPCGIEGRSLLSLD